MKKMLYFTAAVAALATVSCTVEKLDPAVAEDEKEITVLTAGFEEDETRTVRQADGKVFWSPADEISVIRGTNTYGNKFTSTNAEPVAVASFTGTMPSGTGNFWALYPYDPYAYYTGTYLVTEIPAAQEAVAGSYDEDAFISVAYSKKDMVTFSHMCGGVKFSVTDPDIRQVTLFADDDVPLAGVVGIALINNKPAIKAYGDTYSRVDLTAPEGETLEPGVAYHIVTGPVTLSNGFRLLFEKTDGTVGTRTVSKSVSIRPAHFATLMDADKGIEWMKGLQYSPSAITVDALGGGFTLNVRSTVDYHVEVASDWIRLVKTEGDPRLGATLTFSATRNTSSERTGMLIVCDDKNCYPVTVTQGDGTGLKNIVHHSLGMRFTATWCGYCPIMNETFKLAKSNLGDKFDYVCMYATSGNYGFSDGESLFSFYGLGGYPSAIIDGRFELQNYNSEYGAELIAETIEETECHYPTVAAIGLESGVSGRNVTVKVDVMSLEPDTYKLTVLLLENGIIGKQTDYVNGDQSSFQHDRVARMKLSSSIFGDSFTIATAGETKSFDYSATVPSGYNLDNMVVLAYVQRAFGSRDAIQTGSYGDWYVENCRSAALGATAPLEVD